MSRQCASAHTLTQTSSAMHGKVCHLILFLFNNAIAKSTKVLLYCILFSTKWPQTDKGDGARVRNVKDGNSL